MNEEADYDWKIMDDDNVRHVWECGYSGCVSHGKEVHIGPWWYADNGTPMCVACHGEMTYVRTEFKRDLELKKDCAEAIQSVLESDAFKAWYKNDFEKYICCTEDAKVSFEIRDDILTLFRGVLS